MTSTTVAAGLLKPRIRLGEAVERFIGYLIVAVGAAWVIFNFVDQPKQCIAVTLDGLNKGALYALIALGYTLVYGIIELINFAHGDLFMLGTVFSANFLIKTLGGDSSSVGDVLALALTFVVTMAFCAAINMGAEFFAYRRLRRVPRLAPLVTLGVTAALLLALTYIVQRTRQGRAMRATAQDQDGARLMGINVDRTISFTFALGGAMAGTAAVLYIQTIGSNKYDLGFQLGLIAFTAAVLGGIG